MEQLNRVNRCSIGPADRRLTRASLESHHGTSHNSRKSPLRAASAPPAAKFGRHQVFECEALSFEETFVHNALKQSGFIHNKDDSELIRSVSTFTLATSRYFVTAILDSVAHCTPVCQTIAKHLSARDILSLSRLNRFTYQGGRHRNRLLTSIMIERYCSQPPAIQEKLRSFTEQIFSKTPPAKLAKWLENHFSPQDRSWVESDPSRLAALARSLYKRLITVECCDTLSGHISATPLVFRHPDGLIISGSSCDLKVLDLKQPRGRECITTLSGHRRRISCITTLPNGWVVSGSYNSSMKVWDLKQPRGMECIATLGRQYERISCVTVHPRGWIIAGIHEAPLMRVWDLGQPRGMECITTLSGHSRMITSLTTHPQGWVISASHDDSIKIWDLNQPRGAECITTLLGHTGPASCFTIHPRGWIISGSLDMTVRIWDLNQPGGMECIATLRGHPHWINCITSLSDLIISSSFDKTLKVWDLNQPGGMECIATLTGHSDWIDSVATISDSRVITASHDGTLKVWNVSIDTDKGFVD